jgi:hypothetical protein
MHSSDCTFDDELPELVVESLFIHLTSADSNVSPPSIVLPEIPNTVNSNVVSSFPHLQDFRVVVALDVFRDTVPVPVTVPWYVCVMVRT